MHGGRPRSLCLALGMTLLLATRLVRAQSGVSIHYESADQLELAIDGYAVEVSTTTDPSPCDPNQSKLVSVPRGTKAWIRLAPDPSNPDTTVASICYLGAQPFLQQASPSAPRAEAQKLALATA